MINGLDLSHWNAVPDLTPYSFVIHKATEGSRYVDPTFADRWPRLRGRDRLRGAYLFGRAGVPARAQLDLFLETVPAEDGDIIALDWEWRVDWQYSSSEALAGVARDLIDGLALRYPRNRVVLYCNRTVYRTQVQAYRVPLHDGLWIASPMSTPVMSWVFWQYKDAPLDHNYGNFDSFVSFQRWARFDAHPSRTTTQFLMMED